MWGIAGSYARCRFNFIGNCQAVFQSGCTILHFYQQCRRVPVQSSASLLTLGIIIFIFILAILIDIKLHLIVGF